MPWRRRQIIRRFASGLVSGIDDRPITLEEARPRLLPNVRSSAMWNLIRLDALVNGSEVFQPPGGR